ncbi:LapA family protein [Wenzhouxiangella limi]|uniref:LapA family protein n=1 Tax=Wenzhouxiangella limi TaxID=2707351 RepID=A0A845V2C9_9GAMM|nr:LapA family protein [Wenzhouxiangella limi]NDY95406.1 LapA family protein [Wenzhouxiangella limi]
MYRWLLLLAVLVAALLGLAIGVLNPDPVALDLGLVQPSLPLGGLVLIVFAAGTVCGLLLFWLMFDLPARVRRRAAGRGKGNATGLPVQND